ncbi:sensor histidine kinase [Spirillospora albida]|uniref:sensor histidine kinase n=1 Tax=Spirillospora albida TaxID=58123 RepID=UPI0006907BA5|nr:nitrate- and nitrite sensing domain-containing protein [Spirillospora albida]
MKPGDAGRDHPQPQGVEAWQAPSTRAGSRLSLRNWRVPQRLIVLILVPTAAAVLLAGLRISSSAETAAAYGRVERMAELGETLTRFVHEFAAERDLTIEYIATGRDAALRRTLRDQQEKTDAQLDSARGAAQRIDASHGSEAVRDATAVLGRLDGLAALRSLSVDTKVPAFTVLQKYSESTGELVEILDGLSQNVADAELAESSRALGSLARAKDAVSRERALLLIAARSRRLASDELNALTAARAQEDSELNAFGGSASLAQRQLLEDTVVGTQIDRARDLRQRVIASASANGGRLPASLGTAQSALVIRTAMTSMIDQMRAVEQRIAADIRADSDRESGAATTSTIIEAVVAGLLLLIVLAITAVMARSLVRPLRRLQSGALEIAGARLPGLVDRLRDPEAAAGGIEVEPIDIDSTDEIGQVARAFDEVHREAVRLAADEAVLRGNINAMFVNLSRRSQSLIERQLKLIEELEQSERDEEQLANLFRLDHLATRMRRNNENLLVLGGQEQVRRWNRPVPLIDVVRASLSEVEQYERVSLRVQGDMTVGGPVVNDLVHLLAELIENATVFSSDHTKVTVSGQMLTGGGAMLQITDSGVGMAPEELEQANWRLVNPPVIDFGAARRMGLFVVGRLAVRHGIRVELRAAQGGGLTAFVVLPDAAVSPGEPAGVGTRGFGTRESPQLAALTAMTEPPAIGGAFRDEPPAMAPPARATGGNPMVGGSGAHRILGGEGTGRPGHGITGPQPVLGGTGPLPAVGGPGTGPLPRVPEEPAGPAVPEPRTPADRRPARGPGELPVRQPGAQLPGRPSRSDDGPNGLFQPSEDREREPAVRDEPVRDLPAHDVPAYEAPAHEAPAQPGGLYRRDSRTGPLPVVPEAQPAVPEPAGNRQISWETGPFQQVADMAAHAEPAGRGPLPPDAGRPDEFGTEPPMPDPSGYDGAPAPARQDPPRVPARSPIFDAMQSEWFQRRTDGEPGGREWESPADAGFRAAEAAREPVAETRTSVGLPKRVPGKNRVPGAVNRSQAGPAPQARPPAAPDPGRAVPGQAVPGAPGQTADVVRNRFASLQRGVHRARTEARDGGTSGEAPSQGDGETGGTR